MKKPWMTPKFDRYLEQATLEGMAGARPLNNRVQCEPDVIDAETECSVLREEVTCLHSIIDQKDDQIRRLTDERADAQRDCTRWAGLFLMMCAVAFAVAMAAWKGIGR